jgi:ArsR family transcriptional regulator, arsenate/arsenite/antimonite-responsive transcriptional repressor
MQSVFRALADETRRAILAALADGPKTSGELADLFDSSWPTISRHLAVLRQAGLVISERQGQAVVYELNTTVFQEFVQHVLDMAASGSRRRVLRRQSTRQRET